MAARSTPLPKALASASAVKSESTAENSPDSSKINASTPLRTSRTRARKVAPVSIRDQAERRDDSSANRKLELLKVSERMASAGTEALKASTDDIKKSSQSIFMQESMLISSATDSAAEADSVPSNRVHSAQVVVADQQRRIRQLEKDLSISQAEIQRLREHSVEIEKKQKGSKLSLQNMNGIPVDDQLRSAQEIDLLPSIELSERGSEPTESTQGSYRQGHKEHQGLTRDGGDREFESKTHESSTDATERTTEQTQKDLPKEEDLQVNNVRTSFPMTTEELESVSHDKAVLEIGQNMSVQSLKKIKSGSKADTTVAAPAEQPCAVLVQPDEQKSADNSTTLSGMQDDTSDAAQPLENLQGFGGIMLEGASPFMVTSNGSSPLVETGRSLNESQRTIERKGSSRYWTGEEHERFLEGLNLYGHKDIKNIAKHVGTRNPTQVRTHAQKYYLRLSREAQRSTPMALGGPGDRSLMTSSTLNSPRSSPEGSSIMMNAQLSHTNGLQSGANKITMNAIDVNTVPVSKSSGKSGADGAHGGYGPSRAGRSTPASSPTKSTAKSAAHVSAKDEIHEARGIPVLSLSQDGNQTKQSSPLKSRRKVVALSGIGLDTFGYSQEDKKNGQDIQDVEESNKLHRSASRSRSGEVQRDRKVRKMKAEIEHSLSHGIQRESGHTGEFEGGNDQLDEEGDFDMEHEQSEVSGDVRLDSDAMVDVGDMQEEFDDDRHETMESDLCDMTESAPIYSDDASTLPLEADAERDPSWAFGTKLGADPSYLGLLSEQRLSSGSNAIAGSGSTTNIALNSTSGLATSTVEPGVHENRFSYANLAVLSNDLEDAQNVAMSIADEETPQWDS
eukprot:CAMPEP_0182450368 /NCGR_PEP_ID=MMETSP1172-20130603/40815_1 /TAXON_ID=708627 /ORGANISM="Timspurckia oligopyrenoides, Strain CCMP3278" /LENGTH=848 /DNA_ID=CAMNT_0024647953 /DNA_START=220 /DNA_END=2766 /DNA_ORIENTATION=-